DVVGQEPVDRHAVSALAGVDHNLTHIREVELVPRAVHGDDQTSRVASDGGDDVIVRRAGDVQDALVKRDGAGVGVNMTGAAFESCGGDLLGLTLAPGGAGEDGAAS